MRHIGRGQSGLSLPLFFWVFAIFLSMIFLTNSTSSPARSTLGHAPRLKAFDQVFESIEQFRKPFRHYLKHIWAIKIFRNEGS